MSKDVYLDRYYSMDDCDLKTFIFDNIYAKDCENCWLKHQSGLKKIGEMNPNACTCYPMRIFNPDEERMEYSKQLMKSRSPCVLEELNGTLKSSAFFMIAQLLFVCFLL